MITAYFGIYKEIVVSFLKRISTLVISFICLSDLDAQLCQGSLGDPIINITFGAGANPGASLKAATTSYQYLAADCPNDGSYTVVNKTISCFGGTWHTLSADHTGDPNGYFMLVNASFQPSAFYIDTVKGLCGNTTYEFAAWIANVLRSSSCNLNPIHPNLTFTLEKTDGTILQSYNTGSIVTQFVPTWQQFGFFFTTPANVSNIILRIFNNAQGGCGNDIALDDITFRACGPQLAASIAGSASSTVTICEGTARSFNFICNVSAGFNSPSFQWQQSNDGNTWTDIPGAATTSLTRNFTSTASPGKYIYRLSAAEAGNMNSPQCRVASDPLTIDIGAIPESNATSNSPVCQNNLLELTASDGALYQWTGVNNFSATGSPVSFNNAQPILSGKYYVQVTSDKGCKKLDSVIAVVNPKPVAGVLFSTVTICEKENIQLESSGGESYQWIPANGLSSAVIPDPVASPADTVDYSVIVFNEFACSDTALVTVNVVEVPHADAGSDKWIIEGTSAQLSGNATGQNISYSWLPAVFINNAQSLNPVVTPPRDTNYVLKVVSGEGCGFATDTMHVFVYKDVYVPNAFSPNNDGLNDTWNIPVLSAYPEFDLTVYNRYGQVVFQNKNTNRPWNGKFKGELLPVGVYVYVIDLKAEKRILKGTVTLFR
ncbi:MAG TPA: gliding motility-associated C-terminal domain-containing protein [Chitinophagaceae bacterium]|nr:gliding motility-associated C-terminal domain-containing protein [Chitinophagaceae bacterium]